MTTRRPVPQSSSPSVSCSDDDKPAYTVAMRLRAARLVLAYTLPVPVKGGKKDGGWIQQAEALVLAGPSVTPAFLVTWSAGPQGEGRGSMRRSRNSRARVFW